jgi:hypothetical protein
METETKDIQPKKSYSYFFWIPLITVLISAILTCLIFSVLSPLQKIKTINENYKSTDHKLKADSIFNKDLLELKLKEAFLKSRLQLSENDSINLSINLKDSLLAIEIKGTVAYSVPIETFKKSTIFDNIKKDVLVNYFSTPFCILQQNSTFLKEPLIIKKAPKDTTEASKNLVQADTTLPKIVACNIYTDKDLIINIRQSEENDKVELYKYQFRYNYQLTTLQLEKIIRLKVPDYIPWIQIEINKKDAVAIFRALPEHAFISIHI